MFLVPSFLCRQHLTVLRCTCNQGPARIHYYKQISTLYSIFISFSLMSKTWSRTAYYISSSHFLSLLWSATVSQTFLKFENRDEDWAEGIFLNLGLPNVFSEKALILKTSDFKMFDCKFSDRTKILAFISLFSQQKNVLLCKEVNHSLNPDCR